MMQLICPFNLSAKNYKTNLTQTSSQDNRKRQFNAPNTAEKIKLIRYTIKDGKI